MVNSVQLDEEPRGANSSEEVLEEGEQGDPETGQQAVEGEQTQKEDC